MTKATLPRPSGCRSLLIGASILPLSLKIPLLQRWLELCYRIHSH
jgi:hypothetical protein